MIGMQNHGQPRFMGNQWGEKQMEEDELITFEDALGELHETPTIHTLFTLATGRFITNLPPSISMLGLC